MGEDPLATFGALLRGCVGEDDSEDGRRLAKAEVAFFILGVASSVVTSYLLLQLGLIV